VLEVGSELLVVEELEEVVESPVEVVVSSTVEGGRVLLVVGREVVGGGGVEVEAGERASRGRAVEETPAKRRSGGLVVDASATAGGARVGGWPGGEGPVRAPSRPPPHAPTTTATASVAHRRSRLPRTSAPACSSPLDDRRIG
jgi:hypothetical protein